MESEEIDKLFKNRLSGLPATPSPDAWLRLQQKMEPARKQRTMWVYYAAASIVLLLISGLFVYRNANQAGNIQVAQTEINKRGIKKEVKINYPQATPRANQTSTQEKIAQNTTRNEKYKPELTGESEIIKLEKPAITKNLNAKVAKVNIAKTAANKKPGLPAAKPSEAGTPALAQTKATSLPEETPKNTFTPNNSTASVNVVQVLVKLDDNAGEPKNEEEAHLRESLSRKGSLLKNIYKQARNLKNGEPVELAALGMDPEKINTEKENLKQKINKVISL